jgi:hypothetical protein
MCVDNGRPDFVQLRTSLLKIVNAITSWLVCISSPCGQLSAACRGGTIRQCKNSVTVLVSKKGKVLYAYRTS